MSFDYFSIRRMTYFLEKIKDIFDTKADISDVPENLSDLSDVTISSPANGQVPVYNSSTGVWRNGRKIIFSTANPALNVGDELDMYVKLSSNDYGKSFRIYTTNTSSDWAAIAVETIISGTVTNTDYISYKSPSRTYSDFNTTYSSGNWRVNITTNNVDGRTQGEQIAWAYYSSQNLSLVISPPVVYGIYIKSNGVWISCKDVPINAFADLTDTAFTNLQNGQVAIYNSTTGKWENGNIPSANDGTLTIQKNGVDIQTFSANQSTDVTANITVPTTAADVGAIPTTQKGVASGVAELDATGKVPSSQLPSYVDDTIEGYLYNGHWYSDAEHTQEVVGETGKIYVELSTNKTYRWSGTTFVEISESLALGETSSTAYRGDRGATAYSHATDANKVSSATATGLYKVGATAEGHISELQAVQKLDITNLGIPSAVKLTITVSESEDPQTGDEVLVADKTPSEVLAALNGGMVVEAVYEGRVCSIAHNLLSSAGRILFGVTVGGDNVGLFFNGLIFIKDSQDDAWESITLINSNVTQRLNASIDYSNNTYSCDYTYDEFEDARSNGQEILVEYDDVIYYFTKYDSSEYTYYFSSTLADSDGTTTNTFVMVGDDSTGDWDSITLTESSGGSASSFLVRVYEDPQTQQTTCDKLPSEILAAYTNGSIIQAKIELEGEDAMLDLATCLLSSSPYLVVFSTLVTRQNDDTVTLSLHLQKDSSSDTWEDIDIYQSNLCHYVGNISHDTNGYYFDITPSMFDDAISYSLGARIKYVDNDNDVTYDFYLSRYDASDSEHTVFYLTSVNADSTGETTILTFALYPDWELDEWDNIVLYETNGSGDIIWTGTQAEYNAQASSIPNGTTVHITDDEEAVSQITVVDNLTTQDATKALSANQGYVLKQYLDNKTDIFTITINEEEELDKTPLEVLNAYQAGTVLFLLDTRYDELYLFDNYNDYDNYYSMLFSRCETSYDGLITTVTYELTSSEDEDVWDDIDYDYTELEFNHAEISLSNGSYSCSISPTKMNLSLQYRSSLGVFLQYTEDDTVYNVSYADFTNDVYHFSAVIKDASNNFKLRTFVLTASGNSWGSITMNEVTVGGSSGNELQAIELTPTEYNNLPSADKNDHNKLYFTRVADTSRDWSGLTSFAANYIWTDGTNIYYSDIWHPENNSKLNGNTWEPITWTGLTAFAGSDVWTDGTNIYYSSTSDQYKLNGTTWEVMTWTGLTNFYGKHVWTDGTDIYYSNGSDQYKLNGTTWETMNWTGLTSFYGSYIWSDGTNIYHSYYSSHHKLNGTTWESVTWTGLTNFYGNYIWIDGTNIYCSYSTSNGEGVYTQYHYKLNGTNWDTMIWSGLTGGEDFYGYKTWTDGIYTYYSDWSTQYRLDGTTWVTPPCVVRAEDGDLYYKDIKYTGNGGSGGASPSHMYIISSAESEIEVETPSGETITPTQTTGSTTQWECDTTEFGEHTITVTLSNVDYTHDVIIESVEVVKVIYDATNDEWIDIRTSSGKPELTMAQYNYLVENNLDEPDVDYHIKDASPVSAKSLDDLMDVEITSPSNDQSLVYDNVSEKWENKVPAYVGVWTATVSGSVGDTTITFTNSNITTTSILDLYCENESGTPIVQTNVSISAGEAEYTIPALEEATDFKLWIRNL